LPPKLALIRLKNQDFSARNTSDYFRCTHHPAPKLPKPVFLSEKPLQGSFPAFEKHLNQSVGEPNVRSVALKTFHLPLCRQQLPTQKNHFFVRLEAPKNGGMSKKRQHYQPNQ
jgi:hypothetical protein